MNVVDCGKDSMKKRQKLFRLLFTTDKNETPTIVLNTYMIRIHLQIEI